MKNYEGMFLVDSREKKNTEAVEEQIKALVAKCGGELKECEKWDERKTAYEIDGTTNGLYLLTYFTGEEKTISMLNREVQLSPLLLRALFLRVKAFPSMEDRFIPGSRVEPAQGETKPAAAAATAPAGAAPAADAAPAGAAPADAAPTDAAPADAAPADAAPADAAPADAAPADAAPADAAPADAAPVEAAPAEAAPAETAEPVASEETVTPQEETVTPQEEKKPEPDSPASE